MKLALMTQNVQGLNDQAKVDLVQHFFRSHTRNLEILCLQEHKLRGNKIRDLGNKVWSQAEFIYQEAAAAYNTLSSSMGAGSGGVCMWLAPTIRHLIKAQGHSRSGRYQWVRLTGVPGQDVGVLNVYAANRAAKRCELWCEMLSSLPRDCRWICAGDWNFVESPSDRSRPKDPLMTVEERQLFGQLKATFDLEDPFPPSNSVRYSWDNRRIGD
jgi:exonuclease III